MEIVLHNFLIWYIVEVIDQLQAPAALTLDKGPWYAFKQAEWAPRPV
jgi:hypothetical protein